MAPGFDTALAYAASVHPSGYSNNGATPRNDMLMKKAARIAGAASSIKRNKYYTASQARQNISIGMDMVIVTIVKADLVNMEPSLL